ncbi:MAG: hypothetical protein ACK5XN_11955, partial [Bacteroidota bacterium]
MIADKHRIERVSQASFQDWNRCNEWISAKIPARDTAVVVGGHFVLGYSKQKRALVPLIVSDAADPAIRKVASENAADFPEQSWSASLDLISRRGIGKMNTRLMIVVNDNLFTQQNWGGSPETLSKATILRTSFYQDMSALPRVYEKAREQAQVPSEVIMRNRDSSGAETIYFSEHSLRSAFLKKTLPVAEHLPGFTAIRSASSKVM